MNGWLMDVQVINNRAKLFFKTGNCKLVTEHRYLPYFYAITEGNIEEAAHMILQHPSIADVKIEEKLVSLLRLKPKPVLRITTSSASSFKKTIKDMQRVPHVKELAETNIPHYFRFMLDNGLRFFHAYDMESLEPIDAEMPNLNLAAVKGNRILAANGKSAILHDLKELHDFVRAESVDALVSFGLDIRIAGLIHIDLKKDLAHDIYCEDTMIPDDPQALLSLGRERLLRIIELSSITGARPGIVSRVTPGKLNTFLHMAAAKRNNHLIPDTKKSMERPKSLKMLNLMDKGGLIFYPEPGIYPNIAKCDFASMYPNIIVQYNISPEMMHCGHEECYLVPEAGWRICKTKKGIIPQGIEKVLRRRLELKRLMKQENDPKRKRVYDIKQRALKNILVCSFGYLGYSNFIFSNVECKECVMLYGREILLRTKEIAESMGLDVIYGIVDSVFVKGGSKKQYKEFAKRASSEIGIELELDCVFKNIAFPAADDSSGIANKYYGITQEDVLECRGIALRHSDAPPIIKEFQEKAVRKILAGENADGVFRHYEQLILGKKAPLGSFAMTKSLRKHPDDYRVNAPHVAAFMQSPNKEGISSFVYTMKGPKPAELAIKAELNPAKYLDILERSFEELTRGLWRRAAEPRLGDFC